MVGQLGIGAGLEKRCHDLDMAVLASPVERRAAVGVDRVSRRPCGQKRVHHRGVAVMAPVDQRRVAGGVGGEALAEVADELAGGVEEKEDGGAARGREGRRRGGG